MRLSTVATVSRLRNARPIWGLRACSRSLATQTTLQLRPLIRKSSFHNMATSSLPFARNHPHHLVQQHSPIHQELSKRSFFSWLFSGSSSGSFSPALADALKDPHAVIIDVRSLKELEETGTVRGPYETQTWIHAPMSITGSPVLAEDAHLFIPSKSTTPVIIFCRSGNRAKAARHILEAQGYEWVLNGINMEHVEKHMPHKEETEKDEESKKS